MLRTNLSTRPFYNLRAVQGGLGLAAALVVIFTLFNVVQLVRLTASQRTLGARAAEAEAEAGKLRGEAAAMRAKIDAKELAIVAEEARAANAIIDQRAFSWTDLLLQLESTLPEDVRVTAVQPRLENDRFVVAIRVEARRAEDLDLFVETLETTGSFHDVLPTDESITDAGLLEAIIQGVYVAPAREAAAAVPAGAPAP